LLMRRCDPTEVMTREGAISVCVQVIQQTVSNNLDKCLASKVDYGALLEWYNNIDSSVRAKLIDDVNMLTAALGYGNMYMTATSTLTVRQQS
jgi:hypothetical protein